uniref:hypothetical protein n=1 Tax=Acetatifactor sp. TaxID=1872090 RepID=UPI0040568838
MENAIEPNNHLIEGHENNSREIAANAECVNDIINMLDDYVISGGSRMKLKVVDGDGKVISKQYHHGRCDVGSPWAKGEAFDVIDYD